jgi:hypothetical protein
MLIISYGLEKRPMSLARAFSHANCPLPSTYPKGARGSLVVLVAVKVRSRDRSKPNGIDKSVVRSALF